MIKTVEWTAEGVRMIDQRLLPGRLEFLDATTVDELCEAIRTLAVRGAPALGVAGAMGMALAEVTGERADDAAARIVEVVNANMCDALRIVSIERGHDPREFSLMAFGGAGPVHAAFLAEELAVPEVVVPPAPGAFSALGLVATDLRRDFSRIETVLSTRMKTPATAEAK